jgi:hypothetical protein
MTQTTRKAAAAAMPAIAGTDRPCEVAALLLDEGSESDAAGKCVDTGVGFPVAVVIGPVAADCPSEVGNPSLRHRSL